MAININGQVLRNVPEQVSKNVEDIEELQDQEQNHETRITALENGVILVASFEDTNLTGTTTITGDVAQSGGDVSINQDLTVGGNVSVTGSISGDTIIETMTGYGFQAQAGTNVTYSFVYAGCVKNGNKLTFVFALNITATANISAGTQRSICRFFIPSSIGNALYPTTIGGADLLDDKKGSFIPSTDFKTIADGVVYCQKIDSERISFSAVLPAINSGETYYLRHEVTFLLSDNMAA